MVFAVFDSSRNSSAVGLAGPRRLLRALGQPVALPSQQFGHLPPQLTKALAVRCELRSPAMEMPRVDRRLRFTFRGLRPG